MIDKTSSWTIQVQRKILFFSLLSLLSFLSFQVEASDTFEGHYQS